MRLRSILVGASFGLHNVGSDNQKYRIWLEALKGLGSSWMSMKGAKLDAMCICSVINFVTASLFRIFCKSNLVDYLVCGIDVDLKGWSVLGTLACVHSEGRRQHQDSEKVCYPLIAVGNVPFQQCQFANPTVQLMI